MPIAECAAFLEDVELDDRETQIAARVPPGVNARLRFLIDVGLHYLTLDRAAGTLAGARRNASGWPPRSAPDWWALYVLDEPSIGLHQRDNHRLIETLVRLRDLGNT